MFTRFAATKSTRSTIVLLIVIASLLLSALTAFGATTYTFADRKLSLVVENSGNIRVSGDRVAYIGKDKAGAPQVYLKSIKTGKIEQITNDDKYKESINIAGDDIFYYESVEKYTAKVNTFRKNLIRYNLTTKDKQEIFERPLYPEGLYIDGSYVVYKSMKNWYVIDLKLSTETKLKSQYVPLDLINGKLLIGASQTSFKELLIMDLKTGKEIPLYSAKEGETLLDAAYNGTHVVWLKETKSVGADGKYKYQSTYTIMDRTKADAKPKIIELAKGLQVRPQPLEFGINYLAYTEMVNDKYIVRGLDLRTGSTFTYGTVNKKKSHFLFFQGDELLMRDDQMSLFLRGVTRKTS